MMAPTRVETCRLDAISTNGHTKDQILRAQAKPVSNILHPGINIPNIRVVSATGLYVTLETGQVLLDASGGPAVACLGYGNDEVKEAVVRQMDSFSYAFSLTWACDAAEELAKIVIDSTGGVMVKATVIGSGSEAVDAAMKLARQYAVNTGQKSRTQFIARRGAFHGTTLGSLALCAKAGVRSPFGPILIGNAVSFVSMPNMARESPPGETEGEYVDRLAQELEDELQRVGPQNVSAFFAETMSGSSMGCLAAPNGYFKAVRDVCDRHGVLLVLDEVICGMGRTGTTHAWQQEDVTPDIQTVAKTLAGGYAPIAMLLMNQRVIDGLQQGSGFFNHGHTYQSHPVVCAAAVAVQKIIIRDGLVENVARMGTHLGESLWKSLGSHPNVGDIRGRGLFWAVEFVQNKETKESFPASRGISRKVRAIGAKEPWNILVHPGQGSVDGDVGDHVMIAPPFNVTKADIDKIVERVTGAVEDTFRKELG